MPCSSRRAFATVESGAKLLCELSLDAAFPPLPSRLPRFLAVGLEWKHIGGLLEVRTEGPSLVFKREPSAWTLAGGQPRSCSGSGHRLWGGGEAGALPVPLWRDPACRHPLWMSDSFMQWGAVVGCRLVWRPSDSVTLNTSLCETHGTQGTQHHLCLRMGSPDLPGGSGDVLLVS